MLLRRGLMQRRLSTAANDAPPAQAAAGRSSHDKALQRALVATRVRLPSKPQPGVSRSAEYYQAKARDVMAAMATTPLGRFEREFREKGAAPEPVKREVEVDETGRAHGTGGRKSASAQVWIKAAENPEAPKVTVNRQPLAAYFGFNTLHVSHALAPLVLTNAVGQVDVVCHTLGGGKSGQAGAVRLGIARALQAGHPQFRAALKAAGMLERDARVVERKKPGQKKARKKFTWVKR